MRTLKAFDATQNNDFDSIYKDPEKWGPFSRPVIPIIRRLK